MFALIIPGRPLSTAFTPIDSTKVTISVPQPHFVSEFVICLLQPTLSPNNGIGVYFAIPPFVEWNFVGSLTLQRPSSSFRAPWFNALSSEVSEIRLGLSVEDLSVLQQQSSILEQSEAEKAVESARGIAQNLYEFMQSFSQSPQSIQSIHQAKGQFFHREVFQFMFRMSA